jgi:hypothetical protein
MSDAIDMEFFEKAKGQETTQIAMMADEIGRLRARLEEAEQQLRLLQKHTSAAYKEKRIVDLDIVARHVAILEELVHKHGLRIPEWQPPAQPPRWAPAEDA